MQSFNLDCGRLDNTTSGTATATSSGGNVTKTNVAYLRTLSAPTPSPSHNIYQQLHHNHPHNGNKATCGTSATATTVANNKKLQRNSLAGGIFNATFDQQQQQQNLTNFQSNEAALNALTAACSTKTTNDTKSTMSTKITPTTILKIEETLPLASVRGAAVKESSSSSQATTDLETLQQKRLRQLNIEMDNIRNTSIDQSQQLSALMQQNHYCSYSGNNSNNQTGNSINNKHKNLMTTSSAPAAIPKKLNVPSTNSPCSLMMGNGGMTCVAAAGKHVNSTPLTNAATSYLLHGSDATKKGSTSTIWTSEESILRSVGAVDEDNK